MHRDRARPRRASRVPGGIVFLVTLAALVSQSCTEALGDSADPPVLTRVFRLPPDEGIFAYARISPDGQRLAYTAQIPGVSHRNSRVTRVIELHSKKIIFSEPGIDAYWSPDGRKVIFLSKREGYADSVSILHVDSGDISRNVASPLLGDYFSWGRRGPSDLILTIANNYYRLQDDRASRILRVPACDGIGTGERPLVSKDGRRITTFVGDVIAVRNIDDCDDIVMTGARGGKADFSFDGRYIAFHAPRSRGDGYEIKVVDLRRRTMHAIADLPGSSLFPSWTRDGRILFSYESADFKGFVVASGFQQHPAEPLPLVRPWHNASGPPDWHDVVHDAPSPEQRWRLILIWAPWSAHTVDAFEALRTATQTWASSEDVAAFEAIEPSSRRDDRRFPRRAVATAGIDQLILRPERFGTLGAANQMPTYVLFDGDRLAGRLLGASTAGELVDWLTRVKSQRATAARHSRGSSSVERATYTPQDSY
jgi:hypothetical protein